MSAASATDVWAVGGYSTSNKGFALAERWNGQSWIVKQAANPGLGNLLYGVAAVSSRNAWAVGTFNSGGTDLRTLIEHWNGRTWRHITSPSPSPNAVLRAVTAVSATDVWAVGYSGSNTVSTTLIEHWDGHRWTRVHSPSPSNPADRYSQLLGVAAVNSHDVWAVGNTFGAKAAVTLIEHWDGHSWKRVPSPDPGAATGQQELFGVAVAGPSDAWTVGFLSNGGERGLALHRC